MKNQPFFTKVKKIMAYPFDWRFVTQSQSVLMLLDELRNSYFEPQSVNFDKDNTKTYQELLQLRNNLYKCWNLHDVTLLIAVEINKVLKNCHINIQIFDLKTKWFLWQNIFLRVDLIHDETIKATAKRKLNILRQISSIFDLGE